MTTEITGRLSMSRKQYNGYNITATHVPERIIDVQLQLDQV